MTKYNPFLRNFSNLEELVDLISDILEAPITLEDSNHRLLAYSMHDENTDSARISTIIGRRVPEKVINSLWKSNVIPTLLTSDQPLRVEEIHDVGLGNRVAISIRKNHEVLGFIWALEINKTFSEKSFTHLKNASIAAKNLLLKLQIKRSHKEKNDQEFFRKLLTGHLKSEQEAYDNFQDLGLTVPSSFSNITFHFYKNIDEQLEKQILYVLKTTQKIKIIFSRIDEEHLIVLAEPIQGKDDFVNFSRTFVTQMQERFNAESIEIGIGRHYSTYTKVRESYIESLYVLKMKKAFPNELNSIVNYDNLGIFQFLELLLDKQHQPDSVKSLIDYDQKNQSDLLHTLEVYLDHDTNIQETAHSLHIHANTLNYRLKRISEIGAIDLKDFNMKTTLYLYLKGRKYNKELW